MTASVLHRAAGLVVAADRPLPGFVPQPANAEGVDLRIHLERCPAWPPSHVTPLHTASHTNDAGQPTVRISRSIDGFQFSYADGTRVWIDAPGRNVWCTWPAASSLDDVCTYLYGPILGLVLRLRGALALHASAVQMGAGAVGFVGPHGAGKSTLAAALGAAGSPVITDDVLHVRQERGRWIAEPFGSMLKLWPEGARLALGESADLPHIARGWNKRALALGERIRTVDRPVRLAALACLQDSCARTHIAQMCPATALLRLAGNSSASHLLDREGRAAEFVGLSTLVREVPCVSITPPEDPRHFDSFVAAVLAWGGNVPATAAY